MQESIVETLRSLIGRRIWAASGGPSTGSVIAIEIGDRRERQLPLSNPRISEELRRYEGEFGLFITCAWRLEVAQTVVCGSESRNESDGEIAGGIDRLVGRTITQIDVDERALDFALILDRGEARLSVFCDVVDGDAWQENYHLTLADWLLIVGPRSILRREERTLK